MKFRPAAILTLMHLNALGCINYIPKWLDESATPFWASRYAALMGLESYLKSDFEYFYREELLRCKKDSKKGCHGKLSKCITHDLWDDLEIHINSFFKKNTLKDIIYKDIKNKQTETNQ